MRERDLTLDKEVYDYLLEGHPQCVVVGVLVKRGMSKSYAKKRVHQSTQYLLDKQYLQEVSKGENRQYKHYHKGVNASQFEKVTAQLPFESRGLLSPSLELEKMYGKEDPRFARPHDGRYAIRITQRPPDHILEANGWTWDSVNRKMKGIVNRQKSINLDGIGTVFLRETTGKKDITLYIALNEAYIFKNQENPTADLFYDCAWKVVKHLTKYGFGFEHLLVEGDKPSNAVREPWLDNDNVVRMITPFGVLVDFSPSKGKKIAEWETKDQYLFALKVDWEIAGPEMIMSLQKEMKIIERAMIDWIKTLELQKTEIPNTVRDIMKEIIPEIVKQTLKSEIGPLIKEQVKEAIREEMTFQKDMSKKDGYV